MVVYLNKVDNFELSLSKFLIHIKMDLIDKNKGISVKELGKYLEGKGFEEYQEFVKKMYAIF